MFDFMNGLLPISVFYNQCNHTHHTRQRNIPHVTQIYGTISERSVTHKGPTTWSEIPQISRQEDIH